MKRCLDTTFLSRALRSESMAVAALRAWTGDQDTIATTEVNYFEVALGIERTDSKRKRDRLSSAWAELLTNIEVLPLTRRATLLAVRRQAALYRAGKPAALADLLIAASAAVGGCEAIVTGDDGDFERIDLLPVEKY